MQASGNFLWTLLSCVLYNARDQKCIVAPLMDAR
jgi:hypothetical protein